MRVVEREEELTVDDFGRTHLHVASLSPDVFVDLGHAEAQCLREALFLLLHGVFHPPLRLHDLGIGVAHDLHHRLRDIPQEGLGEPEHASMAHGPPHDPAQDIAAPLVGGRHPVRDEEGRGARVVGDHLHGHVVVGVRAVAELGDALDVTDDRAEEIGVVVRLLFLHHRRDALEPHARVDGGLGQRHQLPGGGPIELHEDEIPDLEPAVAVTGRSETRTPGLLLPAGNVVALMEVHLGAGSAGAGIAHGPEIVLLPQSEDAVVAEAGDPLPQPVGLVVVREHRRLEPVLGQAEVGGQEFPGEGDRVVLEIVAEGEVAQHLEEGVMTGSAADVLEIVVLAPRPDTLLGGDRALIGALLLAEEDALELHHPRVGEEEGGILGGHERRRAHHGMPVAREIVEKLLAKLGSGHGHVAIIPGVRKSRRTRRGVPP